MNCKIVGFSSKNMILVYVCILMFDMVCMMKLALVCDFSASLGQSMATGCTDGETAV